MSEFKIKTWLCDCGYKQDFEPTDERMKEVFSDKKIKDKTCPSCFVGKLKKATLAKDKSVMTTKETGDKLEELQAKYKD